MPGELCNWETYLKWSNTTRTFTELSDWQFFDFISSEISDECLASIAYSEPSSMAIVLENTSPYTINSNTASTLASSIDDSTRMIENSPIVMVSTSSVQSKSLRFSGTTKSLTTSVTNNKVIINSNNYKVKN